MLEPTSPTPTPDAGDGEGLAQRILDQVAALQQRIDKAERRARIERALLDANAADVHAAADELENDAKDTPDLTGAIRRLKRKSPGLFAQPPDAPSPANLPAQPARPDQSLTILREKARQGDRASLLLYLRARRDKA